MTTTPAKLVRAYLVLLFLALVAASFRRGAAPLQAAGQDDSSHLQQVLNSTRSLASRTNGGCSFARRDQLPRLAARRLETLKQLAEGMSHDFAETHQGNWDNPDGVTIERRRPT